MNKYTVYLEVFDTKMITNITAESAKDVIKHVADRIKITDIREHPKEYEHSETELSLLMD